MIQFCPYRQNVQELQKTLINVKIYNILIIS